MTQMKKSAFRLIRLSEGFRKVTYFEAAGNFSARFELTESVER